MNAKSSVDRIAAWIEQLLASDPPRAKSLVVTIFGDSIAPRGGAIWLQCLIELLRPFGVNERLVRSSVFRLAEEEWLTATRHGRQSRYEFTGSGRKRFERAHAKIYSRPQQIWDGKWSLLIAPSSEIPEALRLVLRRELLWEGFRLIAPGTFCRPAASPAAVEEILDRNLLRPYVILSELRDSEFTGTRPLESLIARHWELDPVAASYERFLARLEPLVAILNDSAGLDAEQAFVVRTLLIHTFRRALLHDPLLPDELLPANWPGKAAYDVCHSTYRWIHSASEQYLSEVLRNGASARA